MKRVAGVVVGALVASLLAVVGAPPATAFEAPVSASCWADGFSSAVVPWSTTQTLRVNGQTSPGPVPGGQPIAIDYSFASGPMNGPVDLTSSTMTAYAAYGLYAGGTRIASVVSPAPPTTGVGPMQPFPNFAFPTATLGPQVPGSYTVAVDWIGVVVSGAPTVVLLCTGSTTAPAGVPGEPAASLPNPVADALGVNVRQRSLNFVTAPDAPYAQTPLTVGGTSSASITAVSGQTPGTTSVARTGATLTFAGSGWTTGPVDVEICSFGGGSCQPATTVTTTADAGGDLSGTATVPPTAPQGPVEVRLSQGPSATVVVPLTVLGTPSVVVSPVVAPPGTTVTVSGVNWNPGATVSFRGATSLPPAPVGFTSDPAVNVVASPTGTFTGSFTVGDPTTTGLAAVQFGTPLLTAFTTLLAQPYASATVATVNGMPFDGVVRADDVLGLTGSGWPASLASGDLTVELCPQLGACTPLASTVSTDTNGLLAGSATVGAAPELGYGTLRIATLGTEAVVGLTVLAQLSLSVTPSSAVGGSSVAVDGTGFPPFTTVTLGGYDGSGNQTGITKQAASDGQGAFSTTFTLTSTSISTVRATALAGAPVEASAPVTVVTGSGGSGIGQTSGSVLTTCEVVNIGAGSRQSGLTTYTLSLSPANAPVGSQVVVTVSGTGWSPTAPPFEITSGTARPVAKLTVGGPPGVVTTVGEPIQTTVAPGSAIFPTGWTTSGTFVKLLPHPYTVGVSEFYVDYTPTPPAPSIPDLTTTGDYRCNGSATPATAPTALATVNPSLSLTLGAVSTFVTVTAVEGQLAGVTGDARPGAQVTVAGTGWDASLSPLDTTARVCTTDQSSCSPALEDTLTTDASGQLAGQFRLPADLPPGQRLLWVSGGTGTALTPLTILGTPYLDAPQVVDLGDVVPLSLTGLDPTRPYVVRALDAAGNPTSDGEVTVTAAAGSHGSAVGELLVDSSSTAALALIDGPVELMRISIVARPSFRVDTVDGRAWDSYARPGSVLAVSGRGWPEGLPPELWSVQLCDAFGCRSFPVDALAVSAGELSGTVTLPPDLGQGGASVQLWVAGSFSSAVTFTGLPALTIQTAPSLTAGVPEPVNAQGLLPNIQYEVRAVRAGGEDASPTSTSTIVGDFSGFGQTSVIIQDPLATALVLAETPGGAAVASTPVSIQVPSATVVVAAVGGSPIPPSNVRPGSRLTLQGSFWAPDLAAEQLVVEFCPDGAGCVTAASTLATTASGALAGDAVVPDVPAGPAELRVTAGSTTAVTPVVVKPRVVIAVSPASAPRGALRTLEASELDPGSGAEFVMLDASGQVQDFLGWAPAAPSGIATLTVPVALGASVAVREAPLAEPISARVISFDPVLSVVGVDGRGYQGYLRQGDGTVSLGGADWPADLAGAALEATVCDTSGNGCTAVPADLVTDADGQLNGTVDLSGVTLPADELRLSVTDGDRTGVVTALVLGAVTVTVDNDSVSVGDTVTVSISGYLPGRGVSLSGLDSADDPILYYGSFVTDGTGAGTWTATLNDSRVRTLQLSDAAGAPLGSAAVTVAPTLGSLDFAAGNRTWAGYARAFDQLVVTGSGWQGAGSTSVELCSLDQVTCTPVGSGYTADYGFMSASLTVPVGEVGPRLVRVTAGSRRAVTSVVIEPAASIMIPAPVVLGVETTATLTGLHPGVSITVRVLGPNGPLGAEISGTAGPDGTLALPVTISSSSAQSLQASEAGYGVVAAAALSTSSALQLTGIVGRTAYTGAARAGDQLVVAGSTWPVSLTAGQFSVEACDADGSPCDTASSDLSTDASGLLSGTLALPIGTPTGDRILRVTGGGLTAAETVTVVGQPTLIVATRDLPSGSSWAVSGSGWLPGQQVQVRGYLADGSTPTGDAAALLTASPAGLLSGSVRVYDRRTAFVGGSQDAQPVEATAPVVVLAFAEVTGVVPSFPWSGSARPGDELQVSGRAFTPDDDAVTVEMCQSGGEVCLATAVDDGLAVDSDGALEGTVTMPTVPPATYSLRITQGGKVVAIPGVQVLPALPAKSLAGSSTVDFGQSVQVTGVGWPRGVAVEISGYTAASALDASATADRVVVTTNDLGSFTAWLPVHVLDTVAVGAYTFGSATRDAEASRAVTVSPTAGVVGVVGGRFLPGRMLQLAGQGWPAGPVTAQVCAPSCAPGASLSRDPSGTISGELAIPLALGPGTYQVRFTSGPVQVTSSFTIAAPSVARTGSERIQPGENIGVSGSSWPQAPVSVEFCPSGGSCVSASSTISVDPSGQFEPGATVTVPSSVSTGTSGLIRFTAGGFTADLSIALPPPPGIVVSPSSVRVDETVTVVGRDWDPGSSVTLSLARASSDSPLAPEQTVTAGPDGSFSAPVVVSSDRTKRVIARSGPLTVSASVIVTVDPPVSVTSVWVTSVAGSSAGSFLARPGDEVTLRGAAWTGPKTSGQVTVRLCTAAGTGCGSALPGSLVIASNGFLDGTVTLPQPLGAGSWGLRVSSGGEAAIAPIGVASTETPVPTFGVSRDDVPWGSVVTVTGSGWADLGPLRVRGYVQPTAYGESADASVAVPSGSFSVSFLVRDKNTGAIGISAASGGSQTPYAAVPIDVGTGARVGQVLGQLNGVTGYAREGNSLSVEGDLWPTGLAAGAVTAEFCAGPSSCVPAPPTTLVTDGQGRLSGDVALPAGLGTGNSTVVLSAPGGGSADMPLVVLGPPRAAVLDELVIGEPLTVTGQGFDPGTTVYIYGLEFGSGGSGFRGTIRRMPTVSASLQSTTDPTVTATVGPDGSFNVSYLVNDPDTITIGVYGGIAGTPPVVGAPPTTTFDVVTSQQDQCVVPDPDPSGEGCSTSQNVTATVIPGDLVQQAAQSGANPSATAIELGEVTVAATAQTLTGVLNDITVTDTRGGTSVWSLTASLAGFEEPGGGSIDPAALTMSPTCSANSPGSAPGAVAGAPGQDLGSTVTLCTKNGSVGSGGSTSGRYVIASPVALLVPAFQKAGAYTGTLVITLT